MEVAAGRLFAHFIKKVLEGKPARVIDPDPAPSVAGILLVFWVAAAVVHRLPCPVGRGVSLTVRRRVRDSHVSLEAATRPSITAHEAVRSDDYRLAAVALREPENLPMSVDTLPL